MLSIPFAKSHEPRRMAVPMTAYVKAFFAFVSSASLPCVFCLFSISFRPFTTPSAGALEPQWACFRGTSGSGFGRPSGGKPMHECHYSALLKERYKQCKLFFSNFPFSARVTRLFKIERNAVRVFPLPVGEEIRIFCLLWMFITPNFCASEKSSNFDENHSKISGCKIFLVSDLEYFLACNTSVIFLEPWIYLGKKVI